MKAFLFLPLVLGLLLSACASIERHITERRIEKHQTLFNGLPAETQQKLRDHVVELGYSPEMVFIALGNPDQKTERTSTEGQSLIWSYRQSYSEYAGPGVSHYERVVYRDQYGRSYVRRQPVFTTVYTEKERETIRIEFKEGKVVSIEKNQ